MRLISRVITGLFATWMLSACAHTPAVTEARSTSHPIIGAPTLRTIVRGGRSVQIVESDLVPLPHLSTTPAADRKRIDSLIAQTIDLKADRRQFDRATNELERFGKAPVPRVLNKMYETPMNTGDDLLVLNRLCRFLRQLTGRRFGFLPASRRGDSIIGATEGERISALKQWFAFWAIHHDRTDWQQTGNEPQSR